MLYSILGVCEILDEWVQVELCAYIRRGGDVDMFYLYTFWAIGKGQGVLGVSGGQRKVFIGISTKREWAKVRVEVTKLFAWLGKVIRIKGNT